MRCDNCPLCPIAEDDVCLESEGKYGIEHADGMLGCKHPWNWIKKRDEEYTKYLGNMGTDMVVEDMFSEKELADLTELCKHMVGLDRHQPYHRHGKAFYKPYRNYFCDGANGNRLFDKLTGVLGLITSRQSEKYVYYYLTRSGLDWLGRRLKIEIGDERN